MGVRLCLLTVIFLKIILISGKKLGSLTFVIDDTYSMQKEINQVRDAVEKITTTVLNTASSKVENITLVTFNDPDATFLISTTDISQLKDALSGISAHGGFPSCPEACFTGIKEGLTHSHDNSYIFVFTDASPRDKHLIDKVISLAQNKQSQIVFILTPSSSYTCRRVDIPSNFDIYYDIIASTFGQVFNLNHKSQVKEILDYIALIVSEDRIVIDNFPDIPPNERRIVPFTIDDETEYVMVSASGKDVELEMTEVPAGSYRSDFKPTIWSSNIKELQLENPPPGDYKATVKGSSRTSVRLFGRTDFVFKHGFSEQRENYFNDDVKLPIDGTKYHLLIEVSDPRNTVKIQTVQIITLEGAILNSMPLHWVKGNYYTTDSFQTPDPSIKFFIQVTGEGKATGKPIRRKTKTPIETRPKHSDPKIAIEEKGSKEFKSTLWLTCKVTASPQPNVIWKDENGNILSNNAKTKNLDTYNYVNELTIERLMESQNYYCYAENDVGQSSKHVRITVNAPFSVSVDINASKYVEYEKPTELHCDIKSKYSMQIDWYQIWDPLKPENRKIIKNSAKYTISNGGTKLRINSVNKEDEGQYVCQASLLENKKINREINTYIKIKPLVPIMYDRAKEEVYEHRSAVIRCNVKKAYPVPSITWQFKHHTSGHFQPIAGTEKELSIDNASLEKAGVYKCIARNIQGSGEQETEVIVTFEPKVTILINNKEQTTTSIEYRSNILLTCKVTSHSKDVIEWRNSKKEKLNSDEDTQTLSRYNYSTDLKVNQLTEDQIYFCYARNNKGETTKRIEVTVKSPFIVESSDSSGTTLADYGHSAILRCKITSKHNIRIEWYQISDPLRPENRKTIRNSAKYNIINGGTGLRINTVYKEDEGKYFCRASLADDKNVYHEINNNVKIIPFAPIMAKRETIRELEQQSISIKCNITKAYPEPKITWQFKKYDSNNFETISGTSKDIIIEKIYLQNTGVYKCTAQNVVGRAEQETEVIVMTEPKVSIFVPFRTVDYGGDITLICVITSHFIHNMTWGTSENEVLKSSQDEYLKPFTRKSYLTIRDARRSKSYFCKAGNEIKESIKSVQIDVKSPLHVDTRESNTNVKYADDVSLKCEITSRFPLKITWSLRTKRNPGRTEIIRNSDKFSISEDGTKLKIRSVSLDLEGKYTCKASLVNDEVMQEEYSNRVNIIGLESPKIDKQKPTMRVQNGTKATLTCRISKGLPKPTINWSVKYRRQDVYRSLNHSKEVFVIENSEYNDTGIYKCEATNIVAKDEQVVDVTVEGPPMILSSNDKIYSAVEGDVVAKIPCAVVGYPIASITWLNNSKKLELGDKYNKDADGTLVIKKPLTEDSSEYYTCKAENEFGVDVKTFELEVTDYIRFDEDFGKAIYIDLLIGETRKIADCRSGTDIARWYKQWRPSNMTATFTITNANYKLHSANYTCRISNSLGSKSYTYIVDVGSAPKFVVESEENEGFEEIEWEGKPEEKLDCNVRMHPYDRTVKIQWLHNNKTINEQSLSHLVSDWGTYSCYVSNVHGEVTRRFRVFSTSVCLIRRSEDPTYPLLLDTEGGWPQLNAEPDYIAIDKDDSILLSCGNSLKETEKQEIVATCDSEDRFLVDGNVKKYEDFQCKAEVTSKVVPTGEKCTHENTETVKVGFTVKSSESHYLELYSVCYDRSVNVPLYTRVTMRQPINYNTASYQKWRLNNIVPYCDINNVGCCLENTHLVNSMDVREGSPQRATYIAENTVLIWNNCGKIARNVTWQKFEEKVRSLLNKLPEIEIYTGAHFVKNVGLMVPRYLWKLYKMETSYGAVVYVNDPNPTKKDVFCKTPCETYGVQLSDEFTYCCSLSEFQNHFTVPSTVLTDI